MTTHSSSNWTFTRRFRNEGFGWRGSRLACRRIKEAVAEIRQAARRDPVRAGEGVVRLLERIWPALQHVDSSSGALGNAVAKALDTLIPILAEAPADPEIRREWLERLWQAIQDDGVSYLEGLGDHWGEVCGDAQTASRWADELLGPLRACWKDDAPGGYFCGSAACLSSLLAAGRCEELLEVLVAAPHPFWHYRRFGFRALAAQGRYQEALQYARASGGLNDNQAAIDRDCEELLIALGEHEAAYRQYAISANQGATGLATFRNVAKKYPMKDKTEILVDLVASTPGQEGRWFATARRLGLLELALRLAHRGPVEPRTLNRAARDLMEDSPRFALEISLASLRGLCQGWGYEVGSQEVLDAYRFASQAAERLGLADRLREDLRDILTHDGTRGGFVHTVLSPILRLEPSSLRLDSDRSGKQAGKAGEET